MMRKLFAFSFLCSSLLVQAQSPMVVQVNKPVTEIQPTMWGIFFEDINFAADGGLYPELIKNRSFEFAQPMMGWEQHKTDRFSVNRESGYAMVINREVEDVANPRYVRVTVNAAGYGMTNEGFRGMGIKENVTYTFSMLARVQEGNVSMRIELVDGNGKKLGEASVTPAGNEWKKYTSVIKATATEQKAKLNIWYEGKGVLDIDMLSLFPGDTWKNRPNGLRADLVQLLADLKPGFLRFPGGCIVEGRELATRYQWKKTVGDLADRTMIVNRWNTEFRHRPAPDYFQSFGLGFYEYFLLSEDLGAEPLPIISCGLACQFNTAEVVPMDQLDPYIQDALDLIEFANGPVTSSWGKMRAEMGHPEPFNLKFIGVGNEQWGPQYIERYAAFVKAIKSKYPDIIIVTGTGPFADGELFEYADKELRAMNAEIIDEHYYKNPEWFLENAARYDSYDRKGPKIFAGEYAAQSVAIASPENKNNWQCALAEAAFMTGLERNAEVVHLTSYAPLFAHVEGWQWTPDLIWFDNLNAYGTPNYYVQQLFSTNKGTHLLPLVMANKPVTGQSNLYASAVLDRKTNEVVVKVVNTSGDSKSQVITLEGVRKVLSGKLTVLSSDDLKAENSIHHPRNIAPVEQSLPVKGKKVTLSLPPYSLSVLKVKLQL